MMICDKFNMCNVAFRLALCNKCLTVDEMHDCFATIDMGWKVGGCCAPFLDEELGVHLTRCCCLGRGLSPCQVASWSIQPFGHNRHGPKIGGCAPFGERKLDPRLTQGSLGRDRPPYQMASWSIQPFGHNRPTSQIDRHDSNGPIA